MNNKDKIFIGTLFGSTFGLVGSLLGAIIALIFVKIDELISLIYENMEIIGLDECSALEKELKEIAQMFEE